MGNQIVLCVDDEEVILNSLEMELSEAGNGYQVELAQSGIEALGLIEDLKGEGHNLAVVISDYIMPGMKGDELLIAIHKENPTASKILLTGQSHIDGVTNAINNAGLFRFIEKPWVKEDLKLTVDRALEKYINDQRLVDQEKIINEMNEKLASQGDINPEDRPSDGEMYDQIYFSRYYQTLNLEEKHWFARAAIGMITIDKQLTKSEMNYVNCIVRDDRRKEIVEEYIEIIKNKTRVNLESIQLEDSRTFEMVKYLSHLMVSKKKIKEVEEDYFYYVGKRMGIDDERIKDFLKIINHRIRGDYMEHKLSLQFK